MPIVQNISMTLPARQLEFLCPRSLLQTLQDSTSYHELLQILRDCTSYNELLQILQDCTSYHEHFRIVLQAVNSVLAL